MRREIAELFDPSGKVAVVTGAVCEAAMRSCREGQKIRLEC